MRATILASSSSATRAAASTSSSLSPSQSSLAARRCCSARPLLRAFAPVRVSPRRAARSASTSLVVRAERRDGSSGFTAGFILGGVVFGALGFLFAPQISSALLSEDQSRLKLPRFLDDTDADGRARSGGQPMTKQDLADRIAQLNSAIDDVSAQLRAQDEAAAAAAEEGEAVSEVAA